MLKFKGFFSLLLGTAVVGLATFSTIQASAKPQMERMIVVFKQTAVDARKDSIIKKHGAVKLKDLSCINGVVVKIPNDGNLKIEEDVEYIEDDYTVSIEGKLSKPTQPTPTATLTPTPTPTPTITSVPSEFIPWGIEWIGAPGKWSTSTGDTVKVAVIDTGIDLNHPDLQENIKGGYNSININISPDDDNGHGTHVAGIIAAIHNGIGVVGAAPDADLYAVKVLNSTGNGYVSDVIEGIDWCIKNGMDMTNMSLTMPTDSKALHDVIIQASQAGITMVAAAGNNYGGTALYPAAYPEVISVGAIDRNGNVAPFSAHMNVDVYAPGVDIYSTLSGDGYGSKDGTSMAAPHVVGEIILKK